MSNPQSSATSSPLADKLMGFARSDGVLAIHGLQVALIDAAIALDNAAKLGRVSEIESPDKQAVWDMLLLDGNCSDHTLTGPAKLRRILDDLIEARMSATRTLHPAIRGQWTAKRCLRLGEATEINELCALLNELQGWPNGA